LNGEASPELSLRALVAAGESLLAIGFTLRQFWARKCPCFGVLIASVLAVAIIGECGASAQRDGCDQDKVYSFHAPPKSILQLGQPE